MRKEVFDKILQRWLFLLLNCHVIVGEHGHIGGVTSGGLTSCSDYVPSLLPLLGSDQGRLLKLRSKIYWNEEQ